MKEEDKPQIKYYEFIISIYFKIENTFMKYYLFSLSNFTTSL